MDEFEGRNLDIASRKAEFGRLMTDFLYKAGAYKGEGKITKTVQIGISRYRFDVYVQNKRIFVMIHSLNLSNELLDRNVYKEAFPVFGEKESSAILLPSEPHYSVIVKALQQYTKDVERDEFIRFLNNTLNVTEDVREQLDVTALKSEAEVTEWVAQQSNREIRAILPFLAGGVLVGMGLAYFVCQEEVHQVFRSTYEYITD